MVPYGNGAAVNRKSKRKVLLACRQWGSEESIHAWKFLKSHVLQARDGLWDDEFVVVHIMNKKDKDKERWDQGGATIPSLSTALEPYQHDVFDLEGDAGPLLVDIANKEQADIIVLATRGRNAMRKAVMGSTSAFVMTRVNCASLIVKPQVGAGDTYRMKQAAQPQSTTMAALQANGLQPQRNLSPANSPIFRLSSLPGTTPFNRRVAIAYDTTASGRLLLKWAADNVLEPADNVFVVRAVPKMRKPGTSFADKNSVQRLAGDMLQGLNHITTFNLQQQQGMSRKAVLNFVAKESVDLLIIGMYKTAARRKGLGVRGNAFAIANRCACPCLVVPMTDAALVSVVKAADLELVAAEEDELASGSESDSEDEDVSTPTAAAVGHPAFGSSQRQDAEDLPSPPAEQQGGAAVGAASPEPALRGASAIKQLTAPLEALFKRRGSVLAGHNASDAGSVAAVSGGGLAAGHASDPTRAALLAALQTGSSSLHGGRYVVEVDSSGGVKGIKHHVDKHHQHSAHSATGQLLPTTDIAASPAADPAAQAAGVSMDATADVAVANERGSGAADDVNANRSSTAGSEPVPPSNPGAAEEAAIATTGTSAAAQEQVQQLQRALQQREAEIVMLQQQLKQALAVQNP